MDTVCSRSAATAKSTEGPGAGRDSGERWTCLLCGAKAAHWSDEPIEYRLRDGVFVVDGFTREHCDACGEDTFEASQLDDVHCAVVSRAREQLGRLTSGQIHQLRLDLGLTQAALEEQLGVGTDTVGRWERGTILQGATADRLMRILWAHPELLSELGLVAREGRGPYRKRK
jgi:putative zinc finger/helix-turn-helix YgiT family protein